MNTCVEQFSFIFPLPFYAFLPLTFNTVFNSHVLVHVFFSCVSFHAIMSCIMFFENIVSLSKISNENVRTHARQTRASQKYQLYYCWWIFFWNFHFIYVKMFNFFFILLLRILIKFYFCSPNVYVSVCLCGFCATALVHFFLSARYKKSRIPKMRTTTKNRRRISFLKKKKIRKMNFFYQNVNWIFI